MRKEKMELDKAFPVDTARRTIAHNRVTQHWHPFLELGCCLAGEGTFHIADKQYPVKPGDIFVISQTQPHIANCEPGQSCSYRFIYFRASILEASEPELLLPFNVKPFVLASRIAGDMPVAGELRGLIALMGEELEERQIGYRSRVRGALLQACALLVRHYRSLVPEREWDVTLGSFNRIWPALEFVREHFTEPIRLEDVAGHIGLSPSRTYHLFKEVSGDGFKEYLIKLRVREAQRLLLGSALPITEIYLRSGFTNHASFYRSFQQFVKMTPSEYRGG